MTLAKLEQSRQENLKVIKNTLPVKSANPESLKNNCNSCESFSTNVPVVDEDYWLRAIYRLFYVQFCGSSYQ